MHFDDILIYNTTKEQHLTHLKEVCSLLRKKLFANLKTCAFMTSQVICFLSSEGMSVDLDKVKAITDWPEPRNIHNVRSFHSLTTFYSGSFVDFIR